jgi:hypothetical protein
VVLEPAIGRKGRVSISPLALKMGQYLSSKRWYLPASPYGVTTQKNIVMRIIVTKPFLLKKASSIVEIITIAKLEYGAPMTDVHCEVTSGAVLISAM